MILRDRNGRVRCIIRTQELEEEAMRNDWTGTIETNRGGRMPAIPRMNRTTGAAKIPRRKTGMK